MFASTVQPSLISLFSSTASHPLLLASTSTSTSLCADSFISLLPDATDAPEEVLLWHGVEGNERTLKGKGKEVERGNTRSRVLHLQSPDARSTYVQWGSAEPKGGLGIVLPYLHLSVKNLGQLFYFEVDVRDSQGRLARIRISTFQSEPRAYPPSSTRPHPLLHLPLRFPPDSPHLLTPWTSITLHLPTILSSFSRFSPAHRFSRFSQLERVAVHANCRLKRIWCTEEGGSVEEGMALRGMMTELALFAAEEVDP